MFRDKVGIQTASIFKHTHIKLGIQTAGTCKLPAYAKNTHVRVGLQTASRSKYTDIRVLCDKVVFKLLAYANTRTHIRVVCVCGCVGVWGVCMWGRGAVLCVCVCVCVCVFPKNIQINSLSPPSLPLSPSPSPLRARSLSLSLQYGHLNCLRLCTLQILNPKL